MPKLQASQDFVYLGIDPGKNGGISVLEKDLVEVYPMPDTELAIANLFKEITSGRLIKRFVGIIEWINPSIQGIKKADMAKLYGSYMSLRSLLAFTEIAYETEQTKVWARGLGISPRTKTETPTAWKTRLLTKAQQLYPRLPEWKVPKSKGEQLKIADSLLIATFCKRKHLGLLNGGK